MKVNFGQFIRKDSGNYQSFQLERQQDSGNYRSLKDQIYSGNHQSGQQDSDKNLLIKEYITIGKRFIRNVL